MTEYHVNLPQGLLLTVEIEDSPITMHITFPHGKRVTFNYEGNPSRKAYTRVGSGTHIGRVAATHPRRNGTSPPLQRVSALESSAAQTIEYIDPEGSEM